MVRAVDYPRAALDRALEVASTVEDLGGDAALAAVAAASGHAPGGAFAALVAAAAKYGWLTGRRGRLRTTVALRDYRLAGDDALRRAALVRALLTPALYARLADRFAGKPLPEAALPQLLAREYGVPDAAAPRVARYFVDGARAAGLIEGGVLARPSHTARGAPAGSPAAENRATDPHSPTTRPTATPLPRADPPRSHELPTAARRSFTLAVRGPGLESTIEIGERADLALARALLDRVERALATAGSAQD